MKKTENGDLWRREGGHIMLPGEILERGLQASDIELTMADLMAMAEELWRHDIDTTMPAFMMPTPRHPGEKLQVVPAGPTED